MGVRSKEDVVENEPWWYRWFQKARRRVRLSATRAKRRSS